MHRVHHAMARAFPRENNEAIGQLTPVQRAGEWIGGGEVESRLCVQGGRFPSHKHSPASDVRWSMLVGGVCTVHCLGARCVRWQGGDKVNRALVCFSPKSLAVERQHPLASADVAGSRSVRECEGLTWA